MTELQQKKEELEQLTKQFNGFQRTGQEIAQKMLKIQGVIEYLEAQERLSKDKKD